jgi:hypothetical protein
MSGEVGKPGRRAGAVAPAPKVPRSDVVDAGRASLRRTPQGSRRAGQLLVTLDGSAHADPALLAKVQQRKAIDVLGIVTPSSTGAAALERYRARYSKTALAAVDLFGGDLGVALGEDARGDRSLILDVLLQNGHRNALADLTQRQGAATTGRALEMLGGFLRTHPGLGILPDTLARSLRQDLRPDTVAFAYGGAPLKGGKLWPALTGFRSELGVSEATDRLGQLKSALAARSPEQLQDLYQELLGRRYVGMHHAAEYEWLRELGAEHPEFHRSPTTYDAWAEAERWVRERAEATRGRPLEEGWLRPFLEETHRRVGKGSLRRHNPDLRPSHIDYAFSMEPEDLGRIRHTELPEGYVLAGDPKGDVARLSRLADIDRWVVTHQATLSPEALAAETFRRLIVLHPFRDANGRTVRLIVDFLLQRAGIHPPIWEQGTPSLTDVSAVVAALRRGVQRAHEVAVAHWAKASRG